MHSSGGSRGWEFGATASAKRLWRPSDKNAPLFDAYRSRNKGKNTESKLNNALHFVEIQYLRDGL